MRAGDAQEKHWHLDKRVPLALILALTVQTSAVVWWAASITGRVTNTEISVERLEAVTENMRGASRDQAIQLGRIEEQVVGLRADIARLISSLEGRQ